MVLPPSPARSPVGVGPAAPARPRPAQESGGPALLPQVPARRLIPVLGTTQELILRLLVLAWFAASTWFWLWWTSPARGAWNPPRVAVTAFLAWVSAMGGYYAFFVCRMTRPNPALPVPNLRAAMIVTKAPSEPWQIVRRTLEAMLDQDYPHHYDVWLADEAPTDATLRWCYQHGVKISSRQNADGYHRPEWPRRAKCKEGNLSYFYDHWGYSFYDVVAQLDADHVPSRGYLASMVRPFADPAVGYVAAPSICDANQHLGWTVRGRLYREAAMHGPVQAGCNNGWAPVCIGSHYAIRTQALRQAGGLGPELAEDYTTTLWLVSTGWKGVFNIDAEAHGDGPETFDAMITQERQWAHSLGAIATRWAPGRLRNASGRARLRLGFALAYYPLQAGILAAGSLLPTVALLAGTSWGSTSLAGFYSHLWPPALLLTAVTAYLRHTGTLRPTNAKLWSWEHTLFQLTRWPWTGYAFAQGMLAGWRHRSGTFDVTPKRTAGRDRTPDRCPRPVNLLPALLLGALPSIAAMVAPQPKHNLGMLVVVVIQAVLYLYAVLAVAIPAAIRSRGRSVLLAASTPLAAIVLAAGLTARLVILATG